MTDLNQYEDMKGMIGDNGLGLGKALFTRGGEIRLPQETGVEMVL